jgi:DNA-binding beta-propeller fold protein YncE
LTIDNQSHAVDEFSQGSNTILHSCSFAGAPEGIAVQENGKVFVSMNFNTGGAGIVEFPSGLSSCGNAVTLGVALSFAGGLQLDNHNNLVACDQLGPTIDIIDKPSYSSVSHVISNGFGDPFHVALNRYNTLIYVADVSNANVQVLDYPSGTPVTTLNGGNGLTDPAGIALHPFQH